MVCLLETGILMIQFTGPSSLLGLRGSSIAFFFVTKHAGLLPLIWWGRPRLSSRFAEPSVINNRSKFRVAFHRLLLLTINLSKVVDSALELVHHSAPIFPLTIMPDGVEFISVLRAAYGPLDTTVG